MYMYVWHHTYMYATQMVVTTVVVYLSFGNALVP